MQTMGWNMGPVVWWWRLWSGVVDPERQQQIDEARARLEEERQRAEQLAAALAAGEREGDVLRRRVRELEHDLHLAERQLLRVEASAAELRARADELRDAHAEADRVRGQLEELKQRDEQAEQLRGRVAELETQLAQRADPAVDEPATDEPATGEPATGEPATGEPVSDEPVSDEPVAHEPVAATPDEQTVEATPELSAAAEVLGWQFDADDLTVVEGIGPKIAQLLGDAGIATWSDLAGTDPPGLRTILDDAGARFRGHDPSAWPEQADALAHGRWQRFSELRAEIRERRAR